MYIRLYCTNNNNTPKVFQSKHYTILHSKLSKFFCRFETLNIETFEDSKHFHIYIPSLMKTGMSDPPRVLYKHLKLELDILNAIVTVNIITKCL